MVAGPRFELAAVRFGRSSGFRDQSKRCPECRVVVGHRLDSRYFRPLSSAAGIGGIDGFPPWEPFFARAPREVQNPPVEGLEAQNSPERKPA